jgi:hypothetical protein
MRDMDALLVNEIRYIIVIHDWGLLRMVGPMGAPLSSSPLSSKGRLLPLTMFTPQNMLISLYKHTL